MAMLGRRVPPSQIALVQHDASIAESTIRELRAAGHRVVVVSAGRSALKAVLDLTPDILIGAMAEPSFPGLVRELRQVAGAELPVLAIVGSADPTPQIEVDDVIRAPLDGSELALRAGSLLRARAERRALERKVQDLLGLHKISWAFALSGGPQVVYGHLARQSAELLRASKGLILRFEAERRQIVGRLPAFGLREDQVAGVRYSADDAGLRWHFRRNGPLITNKAVGDARVLPELVSVLGLRALLAAPMFSGGSRAFYGALVVADPLGRAGFSEDDLSLLSAVAGQATVAIENLELHEEIKRQNMLLEEYDRAKSEFVAIVAHDFRRPLMAIRGFAEMVLEEPELAAETRQEFMRTIVSETEHLAALANDTLLVAQLETGQVEYEFSEFELGPFLQECTPLGLTQHSVLLDVPPGLPPLVADPERLRRVLGNLLSNAIKYSPDGGSILVRGRLRGSEHVLIEVTDHGLGIPQDQLGRLFQKFARVRHPNHATLPGTGLGLFIARQVVEGHGGRLWVESELGQGSTFSLVLPRRARPVAARAAEPTPSQATRLQQPRASR
jgi:signal transduction histidine kinase